MESADFFAVDPGVNGCGVAWFSDRGLKRAWYEPNPLSTGSTLDRAARMALHMHGACWAYPTLCEVPVVYPQQQGVDPNDLIALTVVVGGTGARELVRPREWKGTVPKDVMTERIVALATERGESAHVKLPSQKALAHNVWDAVGIGYWQLRLLKPKRVIERK
jgi:hypothetical protein